MKVSPKISKVSLVLLGFGSRGYTTKASTIPFSTSSKVSLA
jgi:hypothetical protein